MDLELPSIEFTPWTPWPNREGLFCAAHSGVYALLKSETVPMPGPADSLAHEVVYIGETGGRLDYRWWAFAKSAFEAKFGHSGGWNYRDKFGDNDNGQRLFVAAMSIDLPAPLGTIFRLYVERKLLLDFTMKHGRPPLCNKK